jgi:AraC-like DNA-binding protein
MRYVMEYRIEKAKNLLQQSTNTIIENATICGFQTSSYFGKIFHKETSMCASQYRNTHKI